MVTYSIKIVLLNNLKSRHSIATKWDMAQSIELLFEFIKRDIKIRYKNTLLGISWVVLQPLLFAILFVYLRKEVTTKFTLFEIDYSSMFSVMVIWQFFVSSIQRGLFCITSNLQLLDKINFPKILLPISVIISTLFDATLNFFIFYSMELLLGKESSLKLILLFFILFILSIFTLAVCILISLMQCFIRDLAQFFNFLLKLSLFALPILYNESIIKEPLRIFYIHLPITWAISRTKEIVTGSYMFSLEQTLVIIFISFVFLFLSLLFFKRLHPLIIDYK